MQDIGISRANGMRHGAVANIAAVNVQVLFIGAAAGRIGLGDQPVQAGQANVGI